MMAKRSSIETARKALEAAADALKEAAPGEWIMYVWAEAGLKIALEIEAAKQQLDEAGEALKAAAPAEWAVFKAADDELGAAADANELVKDALKKPPRMSGWHIETGIKATPKASISARIRRRARRSSAPSQNMEPVYQDERP